MTLEDHFSDEDHEDFVVEDSRFIKLVTYNKKTLEMTIHSERKGKEITYTCVNVPRFIFNGFKEARSKGQFFNNNIKGRFLHEYFK